MKNIFLSMLLIASFNGYLIAQKEPNELSEKPGKWSYSHKINGEIEYYKLTADELSKLKQKIETVVETLHQNPILKNPVGFEPSVNSKIWLGYSQAFPIPSLADEMVKSRIIIQFCPYVLDESGNIKKDCMEVSSCEVSLNCAKFTTESYLKYPPDGYHDDVFKAAQNLEKIFVKPWVVKELAEGITAYGSNIIVIANTKRPYWIPVTVGELFDLLLNYYKLTSKYDKFMVSVLEAMTEEKAVYSPEELNLPAYVTSSNISLITIKKSNSPYMSPYMRFNPDYFDKSQPRTNIQLITLYTLTEAYTEKCKYKDVAHQRHYEFVKSLDVNALQVLIEVK